jgi:hypothetical protein
MKCTNCGTDNNLKDRTANGGKCKSCGEPFAFEPSTMEEVKVTDPMFANLIQEISVNGTLSFTRKQFLYFTNRKLTRKKYQTNFSAYFGWGFIAILATIFIGGITDSLLLGLFAGLGVNIVGLLKNHQDALSNYLSIKERKKKLKKFQIVSIIVGVFYTLVGVVRPESIPLAIAGIVLSVIGVILGNQKQSPSADNTQIMLLNVSDFDRWIERWTNLKGNIEQLLPDALPRLNPSRNKDINPELLNYSFDRLLVCDRDEIAHFLITNNFHFENNCAILSINGYPQNIFDIVMKMVRNNSELQVYTIHNCSPDGIQLAHKLRTEPQWFSDRNLPIIDIGISPQQAIALQESLFIRYSDLSRRLAQNIPPEVTQTLSTEDLQWLQSGNYVELESFPPQRLIQIIQRSISRISQLDTTDNALIITEDSSPNYGGNYIYTNESFG